MKVAVILPYLNDFSLLDGYDYFIGVDKGAINALNNKVELDYAIGDFDSISKDELNTLLSTLDVHLLSKFKDETDTMEAIKYAYTISSDVTIFGGLKGRRVDHLYANLMLFREFSNLVIVDEDTKCYLREGAFSPTSDYKYISFFQFEESPVITLKGFKYNLNNYKLERYDSLCISNEIKSDPVVEIENGSILVIESKDDNI